MKAFLSHGLSIAPTSACLRAPGFLRVVLFVRSAPQRRKYLLV